MNVLTCFASTCALMVLTTTYQAVAQATPTATPGSVVELAPVSVGVKSPPMWLFSKGGKKLVVLGTQIPLPESGILITQSIRDNIARANVVLTGPGLDAGDDVSLWQGLTLLRSMRKAQRNEGGRKLVDVVPAQDYARWKSLKAKYMGSDAGVENMRPMFAAYELYEAAIKRNALTEKSTLGGIIAKAAKDAGLQRVDARFKIPVENFRSTVKAFAVPGTEDLSCFKSTLDALENYLEISPVSADAWSVGDVDRYRALESQYQPINACWARLTNEAIGRTVGVPDPYARVDAKWLGEVRLALASNDVVFTTMPARDLVQNTGLAQRLQAEGFSVSELFVDQVKR